MPLLPEQHSNAQTQARNVSDDSQFEIGGDVWISDFGPYAEPNAAELQPFADEDTHIGNPVGGPDNPGKDEVPDERSLAVAEASLANVLTSDATLHEGTDDVSVDNKTAEAVGEDILDAAALEPEKASKVQQVYVDTFFNLVSDKSPFVGLRSPGANVGGGMTFTVGFDVIAAALSAAAHGIPIPSSVIAKIGPDLTLGGEGKLFTTDDHKIHSQFKVTLSGALSAHLGPSKLAAHLDTNVSVSTSMTGTYVSFEHFMAVYMRKVWSLIGKAFKVATWTQAKYRKARGKENKEMMDVPGYREIRALGKKPVTSAHDVEVDVGISASALSSFGAEGELGLTARQFTRRRKDAGDDYRKHESKNGYVVNLKVGVNVSQVSGSINISAVHNDANPDNDGVYITLNVGLPGVLVWPLQKAIKKSVNFDTKPGFQSGNHWYDGLTWASFFAEGIIDALKLTVPGVISSVTQLSPVPFNLTAKQTAGLTIGWYQYGKTIGHDNILVPTSQRPQQLYVRVTDSYQAGLSVDDIPAVAGLTFGAGATFSAGHVVREKIGHDTIAYLKTMYSGMKNALGSAQDLYYAVGRPQRDPWNTWVSRHTADLEKMRKSMNVEAELDQMVHDEASRGMSFTEYSDGADDLESWLRSVMTLFDHVDKNRQSAGSGFAPHATKGDVAKALPGATQDALRSIGPTARSAWRAGARKAQSVRSGAHRSAGRVRRGALHLSTVVNQNIPRPIPSKK